MLERSVNNRHLRKVSALATLALAVSFVTTPSVAARDIDPEADKVLRSMTTYLGRLAALSVRADVDTEILDTSGRKLQLSSFVRVVVQRPDKLYVHRRGPVADAEFIFDGTLLTIHGKSLSVYQQLESPGSIDEAISRLRAETGLDMPGGDLFFADAFAGLMDDVVHGEYMGTAFVNGVECHHLVFRQSKVDWQVWVQIGDSPLPMKYIITSKWVTGAPQYSIRLRDWNSAPDIAPEQFVFTAPDGAKKVDAMSVDEMGEFLLEEYQQ